MHLTHCKPNLKVCIRTRLAGCRPCHCPRIKIKIFTRNDLPCMLWATVWSTELTHVMLDDACVQRDSVSYFLQLVCWRRHPVVFREWAVLCLFPCPPVCSCCVPLWLSGLSSVFLFLFSFSWILLCPPFCFRPIVIWMTTFWIRNSDYIQTLEQRTDSFPWTA